MAFPFKTPGFAPLAVTWTGPVSRVPLRCVAAKGGKSMRCGEDQKVIEDLYKVKRGENSWDAMKGARRRFDLITVAA